MTRLLQICDAGRGWRRRMKKGGGTRSRRPYSSFRSRDQAAGAISSSLSSARGLRTRRRGRGASRLAIVVADADRGRKHAERDALLAFGRLGASRRGRARTLGALGDRRSARSATRRRASGRSRTFGAIAALGPVVALGGRCVRGARRAAGGRRRWRLRSRRGAGRCSSPSSSSPSPIVGAGGFARRRRRPRRRARRRWFCSSKRERPSSSTRK